ncbi:hypothetical protein PanWU01x14_217410, partial [Parasponia andersonii]
MHQKKKRARSTKLKNHKNLQWWFSSNHNFFIKKTSFDKLVTLSNDTYIHLLETKKRIRLFFVRLSQRSNKSFLLDQSSKLVNACQFISSINLLRKKKTKKNIIFCFHDVVSFFYCMTCLWFQYYLTFVN